jgi:hypothetical protein
MIRSRTAAIVFLLIFPSQLNSHNLSIQYDIPSNTTKVYNNDLIVFSSAATCLDDQYTFNYSDPECYTCSTGKYRSIPSQPLPGAPGHAPWLPMAFTWNNANWVYTNRMYGGYGPYHPVYYTSFWPGAGGGGYAYFVFSKWFFYYGSPSIDGSACPCGGGGFWIFGGDTQLRNELSQSTNINWCQNCPENLVCPVGSYISYRCSSGAAAECKYCLPGTYTALESQSSCTPCLPGTYAELSAQSACKPCPPGRYSVLSAQTSCISCPKDTFNNESGKTTCSPCPIGTYTSQSGATACIPCDSGYFFNENNPTSCMRCTNE